MLNKLPNTSIGYRLAAPVNSMPIPLIMMKGIGWQVITSKNYIWNGRKRYDEHCLFQYTLSGEGEIEIQGINYKLKAGDGFIVEIPGEHCYRLPEHSSEWEILYIEFTREVLPFWHQLLSIAGPVISIDENSDFIKLVWQTYGVAVRDEIQDIYQCSKYAYQLIMELISHFQNQEKIKELPSKILLCKQFVDRYYKEQIGLDDMARTSGISKFYLTREFEKEIGMTPGKYLTKVRLENAAKLLVFSTDINIETIAREAGFSCGNYFGKVFKKNTGVSPDEFRRRNSAYEINRVLFERGE